MNGVMIDVKEYMTDQVDGYSKLYRLDSGIIKFDYLVYTLRLKGSGSQERRYVYSWATWVASLMRG